jgi:hypothetical protein
MNNKEILDNAPEGATHYMGEDCFFPFIKLISGVSHAYNFKVCKWLKLEKMPLSIDSRSLADIKRIAELEEVINLVHKDLLLRAELDSDGCKVVDLSSSIWIKLSSSIWIKLSKAKGGAE